MRFSSTPLLVAVELGFVLALAWRCGRRAEPREGMGPVYAYLLFLAACAAAAGVLGARGAYVSPLLLPTLPGLWLLAVPVAVIVLPVLLLPRLRERLRDIVDVTPWHWFAWLHALRIGAVGTAYKAWIGQFPISFELLAGVPDLLFGLSAPWIAWRARRGQLGDRTFLVWNLIGVLVIVPAAPIALQLGLPGPLQIFTSLPDARAVLTYPMALAPTVGVPLFVSINLWVAWRLWERRGSPRGTGGPPGQPRRAAATGGGAPESAG